MTKFDQMSFKLFGELAHLLCSKTQPKLCPKLGSIPRCPLKLGYIRFLKTKHPKTYFSSAATLHLSPWLLWEYVHPYLSIGSAMHCYFYGKMYCYVPLYSFWSCQSWKDDNYLFLRFCFSNMKNWFSDIWTTFIQNSNRYFRFPLNEL